MINITQQPDGSLVLVSSVTDFCGSMGYCEYRIVHLLKGIKPPQTQLTLAGTKAHKKEEKYEKEHVTFVPLSQEELVDSKKDIEFARESVLTRYQTTIDLEDSDMSVFLFGKADKVLRNNGMLIVEDSKYPNNPWQYLKINRPYENQKMQALVYVNSQFSENTSFGSDEWFDIPHKEKVWRINIKDSDTEDSIKLFEGIQTNKDTEILDDQIERFGSIALDIIEPSHHNNKRKCASCRFLNYCKYKIG